MKHELSIRKRLERLEGGLATSRSMPNIYAIVETVDWTEGERHVELVDEAYCHFRELPGRGPQLADFGEFGLVVRMTSAEMEVPVLEESCDLGFLPATDGLSDKSG